MFQKIETGPETGRRWHESFDANRTVEFLRRARLTALAGPGASAYLVFLVWGMVEARFLIAWWLVLFVVDLVSVAQAGLALRRFSPNPTTGFRPEPIEPVDPIEHGAGMKSAVRRQIVSQALAGLVWGSSALWIARDAANSELLLLTAIVLMAVASIAAIGLLHFRSAFITFMIGVWSIPLIAMFSTGEIHGAKLGIGVVVLLFSFNFYLWEASAQLNNGIARRVRADSLREAVEAKATEIERLATFDELTGCMTRRAGMAGARQMVDASVNTGRPQSLVLADLDRFKDVNDTYGHGAGDRVLEVVGRRLRASVRDRDIVVRYGGEEFLVATVADRDAAFALAERLRRAVMAEPIEIDGRLISCTLSAGVGTLEPGESIESALSRVDRALYRAKDAGRNRAVVASRT